MTALDFKQFRDHLDEILDYIVKDNEATIVTRKDSKNVVVMSLDTYSDILPPLSSRL